MSKFPTIKGQDIQPGDTVKFTSRYEEVASISWDGPHGRAELVKGGFFGYVQADTEYRVRR